MYDKYFNATVLIVLITYLLYGFLKKPRLNTVRNAFIWFVLLAVIVMLYAFRFEFSTLKERVLSNLLPSYSWTNEKGQLVIARGPDNHFYLDAGYAKGKTIRFLIDTGASGITLTKEDAKKLGIDINALNFNKRHNTANGISYGATVKIRQLMIGTKIFYDVPADVTNGEMDISLLGMSLINKFNSFSITRDMMILEY